MTLALLAAAMIPTRPNGIDYAVLAIVALALLVFAYEFVAYHVRLARWRREQQRRPGLLPKHVYVAASQTDPPSLGVEAAQREATATAFSMGPATQRRGAWNDGHETAGGGAA